MTAAAVATSGPPAVTEADSLDDRAWFSTHPKRRYRRRQSANGQWIVRQRGRGVLLRTWAATLPPGVPDTDSALREVWFATAWPDLNPPERAELVRQTARAETAGA